MVIKEIKTSLKDGLEFLDQWFSNYVPQSTRGSIKGLWGASVGIGKGLSR